MGTPATLPSDFSGWDSDQGSSASEPASSLPADFRGFDEDKQQVQQQQGPVNPYAKPQGTFPPGELHAPPTFGEKLSAMFHHPLNSMDAAAQTVSRPAGASIPEMAAADVSNIGAGATSVFRHPLKTGQGILTSLAHPEESLQQAVRMTPEQGAFALGQAGATAGLTKGALGLRGAPAPAAAVVAPEAGSADAAAFAKPADFTEPPNPNTPPKPPAAGPQGGGGGGGSTVRPPQPGGGGGVAVETPPQVKTTLAPEDQALADRLAAEKANQTPPAVKNLQSQAAAARKAAQDADFAIKQKMQQREAARVHERPEDAPPLTPDEVNNLRLLKAHADELSQAAQQAQDAFNKGPAWLKDAIDRSGQAAAESADTVRAQAAQTASANMEKLWRQFQASRSGMPGAPPPPTPVQIGESYIKSLLAGIDPTVAALALGMSPQHQENAHVGYFFIPNGLTAMAPPSPAPAGPPQPPVPADATAQQTQAQSRTIDDVAARAQQQATQAAQIAAGVPPPKPATVPLPQGMPAGALTQQTVDGAGQLITSAPVPTQPALIREAVGNLAKWMFDTKTIVTPEGKVVNVDSQKTAQTEAINVINSEIDRQREQVKAQQDAKQKQAEESQKKASKEAEENAKTVEEERQAALNPEKTTEGEADVPQVEIPNTRAVQLARQALEAAPQGLTGEQMDAVIRRTAAVTTGVRKALVEQEIRRRAHKGEDQAQAGMTGQPAAPGQDRESLQAWADAVREGKHPFMHVPKSSDFRPAGLDKANGFAMTVVDKAQNPSFNGRYYHPKKVKAKDVVAAASGPEAQKALDTLFQPHMPPVQVEAHEVEEEAPKTETATHEKAPETHKPETKEPEEETKPTEHVHKFGNTQADIPPDSDAGKALAKLRAQIDPADLMGDGLVEDSHITVRYGIKDEDFDGIRAYLEKQAPFTATLGQTEDFPASEHSDGAVPIIVPVEAIELRRMEKEIEKHGNFAERSFPQYRPHATVAYVKPDTAPKYVGDQTAMDKTFTVRSVSISKRDGTIEGVQLKGPKPSTGKPQVEEKPSLKVGDDITFTDFSGKERKGKVKGLKPNGQPIVLTESGHRTPVPLDKIKGNEPVVAQPEPQAEQPVNGEVEEPEVSEPQIVPPVEAKDGGAQSLVDAIYEKLAAGQSLGNVTELTKLAEEHFGASRTSGEWTPKDMFDAMEAAANRYIIQNGKRWMLMDPIEALAEIREFLAKLTSQGTRTEEQIKLQQFSTPPTESFVAARVAALKPTDVVLEPSAGNGGLAAWPKSIGADVHVNEIAERRQDMLRAAGFSEPTAHNGEILHSLLDQAVKPSVILMNPPFSAGALGGRNRNVYGFNHVESALQRLQKGGRLVAILGGGQANEPEGGASLVGGASGEWFKKLAKTYNVRANVRINGKEYQKYGTSFATRIIVIDKDGPTKDLADAIRKNVDTLEEAYDALRPVAESRSELAGSATAGDQGRAQGAQSGTGVDQRSGPGSQSSGREATGSGTGTAGNKPAPESGRATGDTGTNVAGGRTEPASVSAPASGPQQNPAAEPAVNPPGSSGDIHPERGTGNQGSAPERVKTERKREEQDSSAYVVYQPSIQGGEHPGSIVESKTMATVQLPDFTYRPSLPKETMEGKLSAVQLEPVILAGQANDTRLPGTNARATMLVGDGTGVGKGREAAGMLFDNWNKGRKRLVWVTENARLMPAAKRDLTGVGAGSLADGLQGLQNYGGDEDIKHEGVLFVTYSILRSKDKKGNSRSAQLQKWLRGDDDGEGAFILFDESHNLKNAVTGQGQPPSQIGVTVRKLLEDNPNLRTANLSATAASDVMNLGYLDRLGLWGPGTAFPGGFWSFVSEIGGGGISAMELIARELKAQGRYVSRTLSFKGATYDQVEVKLTDEQKAIYRTATKAWNAVYDKVEDAVTNITNGGGQQRGRFMAMFNATQQRFFNVLLTTLKIPAVIPKIEQDLADGKSVVITLVNTNEAAQNREKNREASNTDANEDDVPEYDFGPSEMLISLVHQYFPTQQYADGVDDTGRPVKIPVVDDEGKPVHNPEAIRTRDELEAELKRDLKMPGNPLDILIQSLGGPNKVAELTGRKEYFDEATQQFVPRGEKGTPRDKVNENEQAKFQSGKKRVAVLSNAAGTGIDLHASLDAKNQQKRSHYTLQSGWSADKAMQMLGRTLRTRQASAPEYHLVVSDMGGEKRFIATIARRLGSLNAISKGQQDAGAGVDVLGKVNFESEQGRQATAAFYKNLQLGQTVPGTDVSGFDILQQMHVLKAGPNGVGVPEKDLLNVTRFLNRVLALDPAIQNAVYDYYFDIFSAIVQKAMDEGTLDTGVKELPGDEHKIVEEKTLAVDPSSGAKTEYYRVETLVKNERVSPEQLEKRMAQYPGAKLMIEVQPKSGNVKIGLVRQAPAIVHADGRTDEAYYVAQPGHGKWTKASKREVDSLWKTPEQHFGKELAEATEKKESAARDLAAYQKGVERSPTDAWYRGQVARTSVALNAAEAALAKLQAEAKDPQQEAKDLWEEKFNDAPAHRTVENHVVGGAVLRWWAPIKETIGGKLNIVTTVDKDSGERVVGVQIPADRASRLLARISGGQSAMTADSLSGDVLRNGTEYRLEGNIRVIRGRVNGRTVVRLVPPSSEIQESLKTLGVVYERGVQPIYYIPTGGQGDAILNRVLKQYPATPLETGSEDKPSTGASNVGSSFSSFGVAYLDPYVTKALNAAGRYAKKAATGTFKELVRAAGKTGTSARNMGKEVVGALYPPALAGTDAKDIMGSALGEPALRLFEAGQFLHGVDKMFQSMPQDEWTEFIARWEAGEDQPNPDLQQAQDMLETVLEQQRLREQEAINLGRKSGLEIDLSNKKNYFPHRWKVGPGREAPPSEEEQIQNLSAHSRRPFEGSKAFMKQQRYTYAEAVEAGAQPIGNPVKQVLQRLQEGAKFVGARWAWQNFKDQGLAVFIKKGKSMPVGYSSVEDKSANVWRVIQSTEETPTGDSRNYPVQTGRWIMQDQAARLLNNYLSKDYVRATNVGSGLIKLKNFTTEIRLAISAFHWLYITTENYASAISTGTDQLYNQGIRGSDPTKITAGLKQLGKSILAPYTAIKRGGQVIQYARNPDEFMGSKEGRDFIDRYPDMPKLMELLFRGGLRWDIAGTFKESFGDHCLEAWKEGELGKGIGKLAPWLAHVIAEPLFEHYIPRSKWAFAVEMLSQKLAQYSQAIADGTKTEIEIARAVAETTDNRFGEFNWDSLYLNNSLRTTLQFFFRSATWKLGSWRGAYQAIDETVRGVAASASPERFAKFGDNMAAKVAAEYPAAGSGKQALARLPELGMNANWIVSMGLVVSMLGTTFSLLATHKTPWAWAKEAKNGMATVVNAALEAMHPRTGMTDTHGLPIRLSFPTGLKDYEHAIETPGRYFKGSMSDVAGGAWDTLANRDAFDNYVYNPQDPVTTELMQGLAYNIKGDFLPMSVANVMQAPKEESVPEKLLRTTGMVGGAPKVLDRSHALSEALSLRKPHTPMTPEQQTEAAYAKEHPTPGKLRRAIKDKDLDYLDRIVKYEMSYSEAKEIYEDPSLTEEERRTLGPILRRKQMDMIRAARHK